VVIQQWHLQRLLQCPPAVALVCLGWPPKSPVYSLAVVQCAAWALVLQARSAVVPT
jgi:hypothetical protein